MMMRELRDGLTIMLKYGNGYVSADHDVIFAGPEAVVAGDINPADMKRLSELDWVWDSKYECFRHYC